MKDLNFSHHFWYRTATGEWANKHGTGGPSELLGDDLPTDNNSIGWRKDGPAQFYTSDIIYYVLTEA